MPDAPSSVHKKTSQNSSQRVGPIGGQVEFCDVFFEILKSRISRKSVRHNSRSARICGFRNEGVCLSFVRNNSKSCSKDVRKHVDSFSIHQHPSEFSRYFCLENALLAQNELCPTLHTTCRWMYTVHARED